MFEVGIMCVEGFLGLFLLPKHYTLESRSVKELEREREREKRGHFCRFDFVLCWGDDEGNVSVCV